MNIADFFEMLSDQPVTIWHRHNAKMNVAPQTIMKT